MTLEAGQPCPVCGSREHPQITLLSDEAPTQAEVESAKGGKRQERKNKRYKKSLHSGNVLQDTRQHRKSARRFK